MATTTACGRRTAAPSTPATPTPRAIAIEVLGRYVPRDCDDADIVIARCQEILAAELDAGALPTARWVVERYRNAVSRDYDGIADQLRPLLAHCDAAAAQCGELAALLLPIARELALDELRAVCLRTVRAAIAAPLARQRKGG